MTWTTCTPQTHTYGLAVRGPSAPLSAPLGSSVVLPCYVDEALPVENLEVEWRRADSETLIHLYQDGESRAEVQQQDYHDRAHFFTEEIQHGNFSLRLDNLTAQDEGEYRCRVHSQQDSGETVAQIKVSNERLLVSGSNHLESAYVGEDVTLNCSVDSHITPEHIEEVSWLKTDEDGDFLVLLYQNNEILPDSSHEQFRGRVEFFTAEIPKGNFSLRLKSVRFEDKGVYRCQVFAGHLSANATVELERLGFSSLHIAVLVFCVAAGSGAVLLLCCLIYCRYKNTVTSSLIWNFQISLVLFPNICMCFAFIFWGFIEGFLDETIICSAIYILRPAILIWALPFLKYLKDNLKPWIRYFKMILVFFVFLLIVYSGHIKCDDVYFVCISVVVFAYNWTRRALELNDKADRVLPARLFGCVVLMCLFFSAGKLRPSTIMQKFERLMSSSPQIKLYIMDLPLRWKELCLLCVLLMPLALWLELFFLTRIEIPNRAFLIVVFVWLHLVYGGFIIGFLSFVFKCLPTRRITLLGIIYSLLGIILTIYLQVIILELEKEYLKWTSVLLFVDVLVMIVVFEQAIEVEEYLTHPRPQHQTESNREGLDALSLCNEVMYMFGAVGVVLLSSVSLTAELILKARNGERVIGDLRVIVFLSECVFALYWMVLQMHTYWKILPVGFACDLWRLPQRRKLGERLVGRGNLHRRDGAAARQTGGLHGINRRQLGGSLPDVLTDQQELAVVEMVRRRKVSTVLEQRRHTC